MLERDSIRDLGLGLFDILGYFYEQLCICVYIYVCNNNLHSNGGVQIIKLLCVVGTTVTLHNSYRIIY